MRNTRLIITVPHLFSPISAKSRPYIITLRFNVHETHKINQSNFLLFNNHLIKVRKEL